MACVINPQSKSTMAKYLISFPSAAMVVPDDEWEAVDRDAHAVIDKAKAAGTATNWRTCQSNGDQNDVQRSLSAGHPRALTLIIT